jgi:hypothetical protein
MAEHGVSCRGACWPLSFGTAGASVVAITGMMAYRHGFEFFVTRLLRPDGPGPGFARERGTASLGQVAAAAGIPVETLRKIETGRIPIPAFFTSPWPTCSACRWTSCQASPPHRVPG